MSANDSTALHQKGVADELVYKTSSVNSDGDTYIVVFLSGNPGLISFYEPFLSTLAKLLEGESNRPAIEVYGRSLLGFHQTHNNNNSSKTSVEDENEDEEPLLPSSSGSESKIYSIQEIIQDSEDLLQTISQRERLSGKRPKIILMGHSVGAYIALELIQRRSLEAEGVDIVGCITLFPTIVDIVKSPNGRTVGQVLQVPYIPWILGTFVRIMVHFISLSMVYSIVKAITGFPDHAARSAAAFVKGSTGVEQALTLGKDEMITIKEDKWTEKVFTASAKSAVDNSSSSSPKLVFYFGKQDWWVSNSIRDTFISLRGGGAEPTLSGGSEEVPKKRFPKMIIDDKNIPHAFPIHHGEVVAEKVKNWVEEIIEADRAGK